MNKELEEIIKKLEDDISVGEYSTTKTETLETALKELKKLQGEKKENSQYKRIKNIINSVTKEELDEAIKRADREFIAKDKIREKIKEVEKELKELNDLQFYNYDEYILTETQAKIFYLERIIKDYKELLEKK